MLGRHEVCQECFGKDPCRGLLDTGEGTGEPHPAAPVGYFGGQGTPGWVGSTQQHAVALVSALPGQRGVAQHP